MFLNILGIVAVLIILVALYVRIRMPQVCKIARTETIQAPIEKVFPYLAQPRLIQQWNPFTTIDPNVKLEYTGPEQGVGAAWSWEGAKAGKGKATIIEVAPGKLVGLRLDFEKPFHVTNFGEYSIVPNGSGCDVTWIINETATIPRVMSVFFNLEKMIGSQFEMGLKKLKQIAEASRT